jgi:hypothetical protein
MAYADPAAQRAYDKKRWAEKTPAQRETERAQKRAQWARTREQPSGFRRSEANRAWRAKNKEHKAAADHIYSLKKVSDIPDSYLRHLAPDIPRELYAAKRMQILIKRKIKEIQS